MRTFVNTPMNKPKRLIFSLVTTFLLTLGVSSAPANIGFDLTNGNPDVTGTGPYVHVTVDRTDTTHATLTYDSLVSGGYIYLLGDGGSVAANINATTFTLGAISGTRLSGFSSGAYSNGGSGNEDGFGSFNQTINTFDGFTNSSKEIVFSVTNVSGTWATDSDVLIANDNGALAAAHVFGCAGDATTCTTSTGATFTGFVANEGAVPEPRLLSVLALGMAGLFFQARRKLSAKGTSANN